MLSHETLQPLSGGKPTSAVILLHGLGDSGSGLIDIGGIWQRGLPETEFLAPDAPFPCDMAPFGYQWFSARDWTPSVVLEGVREATPHLNAFIDHVMATRGLASGRVALVGFSQGTMMSLYTAFRREEPMACVVGYSGALIGAETLGAEKKSAPPVLLVHGMQDEVVPFSAMAHAYTNLQKLNINAFSIARPDLAHSIDEVGLAEGLRFLRKALV